MVGIGPIELAILFVIGMVCLGGLAAIVGLIIWLVVRNRKDGP